MTLDLSAGSHLLNPGSVGQSRRLRLSAHAATLDTENGAIERISVRYPTKSLRRDLAAAGLPARSYHVIPWSPLQWNLGLADGLRSRLRGDARTGTEDP